MKISEAITDNKGFTLIEILLSFAILGIVVAMMASIFSYNANSFARSSAEMKEQSSLRLTSNILTNEFRNIGYIDLANYSFTSNTEIADLGSTDYFIFKSSNGVKRGSAAAISDISDAEIIDISFGLSESDGRYFLGITLTGNTETYTTEVLLNNIITDDSIQMDSADIGLTGFHSIQYNYDKPPSD